MRSPGFVSVFVTFFSPPHNLTACVIYFSVFNCIVLLYVCVIEAYLTRSALLPDDKEIAQIPLGQLL